MKAKQYLKTLRIDIKKQAKKLKQDVSDVQTSQDIEGVEYDIDMLEWRTLQLLSILERHLAKGCTL